jgi:hypothetical protein
MMGRGTRTLAAFLATAALTLLIGAGSASATFHEMKIREVSPGTDGLDNSFLEVQMYAPFQNFLSNGAQVLVCNSNCSPNPVTFSPFANVTNGNSQDTVVFGDSGLGSGSKDFNVNLNLDAMKVGGAVCYLSEPGYHDCVSWGNFSAESTLTGTYGSVAATGTPAPALSSGMALRRSIAAGCATALEPSDDTNNSGADFAVTTPNPRPNSVPPTEATCGSTIPPGGQSGGSGTAKKKKKCKKHKRGNTSPGTGSGPTNPAPYAAKKKCKKKRK